MNATSNGSRFVILAGIDGSPATAHVVTSAARFARMIAGGELHLVHAVDRSTDGAVLVAHGAIVDVDAARSAMLDDAVKAARSAGAPAVSVHVRDGEAARAILQAASDIRADLVMVGTHGRKGVQHLLMGSVAEAVVRKASCPVLVVREASYTTQAIPQIEPPCPACLEVQRETRGRTMWCARHSEHHPRAHVHYDLTEPLTSGSTLIHP